MKKFILSIFTLCTFCAGLWADGNAISGQFTINASGDKVQFSKGNLQYQASTATWRFAEHQYDYVGDASNGTVKETINSVADTKCNNANISSTYEGWIDLFGWATSGSSTDNTNYQPYCTENGYSYNSKYGSAINSATPEDWSTNRSTYDWGVNTISGDENKWRTLTKDEWEYLLNTRSNDSIKLKSLGRINLGNDNYICGIIILPDDWSWTVAGIIGFENTSYSNYTASTTRTTFTTEQWATLESLGAVFLPAAGSRSNGVSNAGASGYYWTSTSANATNANYIHFKNNTLTSINYTGRSNGYSVRLVKNVVDGYTITWKDGDGNTLETDTVAAGVTPTYDGATPTKTATVEYTYSWNSSWDKTPYAADKDETYTAQFDTTARTYTVIWKNYDGTTLETDNNVEANATPSYDGATPTHPNDNDGHTYNHTGWDPTITSATSDQTYTATFVRNPFTYTITWQDADGTTLETDENVTENTTPEYNGSTPTKADNSTHTFTFAGWTPAIAEATENQTYTATYTTKLKANTIPHGVFSVASNQQVQFSKGNLQYQASTSTWRFAEQQYDYVGNAEGNTESTDNTRATQAYWIDLFRWATSGQADTVTKPYIKSNYTTPFGTAINSAGVNWSPDYWYYDWGINSISGDAANTWRTLTKDEWVYLLSTRTNAAKLRSKAKINTDGTEVCGLIILPDNWTWPTGVTGWGNNDGTTANYTTNTFTTAQWIAMEAAGAVFLPAAGSAYAANVSYANECGYYWASTSYSNANGYCLYFTSNAFTPGSNRARNYGHSVRLAKTSELAVTYTVTWQNEDGTTLETDSEVASGTTPTYDGATPTKASDGVHNFTFAGWSPAISAVSSNQTYTATFTAELIYNTLPGKFSVDATHRIQFSKGNLQYRASNEQWQFANQQFTAIGNAAGNTTAAASRAEQSNWIDLFGWATSGNTTVANTNAEPSTVNSTNSSYGSGITTANVNWLDNNDAFATYDWGVNSISGDPSDTWRTLTKAEWDYLINSRDNHASLYGQGKVNNVCGLILLPDDWELPDGMAFTAGDGLYTRANNVYTAAQWVVMETAGAVFLPVTGYRSAADSPSVSNTSGNGYYWTSTSGGSATGYSLNFVGSSTNGHTLTTSSRSLGYAVRLAKPMEYPITPAGDPENPGRYYSTFYDHDNPYILPANVRAFIATRTEDFLQLTEIAKAGDTIPADCAVILRAASPNFGLIVSNEGPTILHSRINDNELRGSNEPIAAPANCYVLSIGYRDAYNVFQTSGIGFYRFTGTIPAHKAYIILDSSAPVRMRFNFDETNIVTAIDMQDSPNNPNVTKLLRDGKLVIIKNGVEYNAQGQIIK